MHCVRSVARRYADLLHGLGRRTASGTPRLAAQFILGGDDQIVPIGAAALNSAKLVKNATLKIYPGAPHGLTDTHKYQLDADPLAFLNTRSS